MLLNIGNNKPKVLLTPLKKPPINWQGRHTYFNYEIGWMFQVWKRIKCLQKIDSVLSTHSHFLSPNDSLAKVVHHPNDPLELETMNVVIKKDYHWHFYFIIWFNNLAIALFEEKNWLLFTCKNHTSERFM